MKVVETENLTKIYHFGDVEVTALNRVNLEIAEHEFVAVWGPSGSGKSTFCNVIGLLDAPTEGDVRIRENSVADLTDAKRSEMRNDYIGFVFQNFNLSSCSFCPRERHVAAPNPGCTEGGGGGERPVSCSTRWSSPTGSDHRPQKVERRAAAEGRHRPFPGDRIHSS